MPKALYKYTIALTEEENLLECIATHHKETGNMIEGKFVLYNEEEIVGTITRGYLKGWSRKKSSQ